MMECVLATKSENLSAYEWVNSWACLSASVLAYR